jgi:histidinol phosphatase-like PHP family hydrolase
MIDLSRDAHVHTAFAAGHDSVSVLVAAAEAAGITELTFADRVGSDTGWLPSYIATIERAQKRTDVALRRGVEVEAIGVDGWLAFPSDLGQLEIISLAISRLPTPAGLLGPDLVRANLDNGILTTAEVAERLVGVLCLAMERVGRYAPTTLARPLEFLAQAGIAESTVDEAVIAALAEACHSNGTAVELSERHRLPTRRVAQAMAAAGVKTVAASDAYTARDVGRWNYLEDLATDLAGLPVSV